MWSYQNDYLAGVMQATASSATPLDHATIARYLPQPGTQANARSAALSALVYLRSLPVLRGAAQRIPAHWQRQVKNWLRA